MTRHVSIFLLDKISEIQLIIQLEILQMLNYISVSHLYKRTRLMSYKYIMRPSEQKLTILFLYYIYSEHISLEILL
jgi:hypothetical protein